MKPHYGVPPPQKKPHSGCQDSDKHPMVVNTPHILSHITAKRVVLSMIPLGEDKWKLYA